MSSKQPIGIKETLTSLTIAFMMAFVFRGFVVEGFIIPTGSMAPTLLGKHVRFVSPHNGYEWTTNYWDTGGRGMSGEPLARQGVQVPMTPTDPMTGLPVEPQRDRRLAAGDRVFVLKYLPGLHRPERWDVVVFKYPGTHENYIKRLVGLPGEQIAMVDGDVFSREHVPGVTSTEGPHAWQEPTWRIARKPERVQRAMLQPVFDSRYAPVRPEPTYRPPISPDAPGAWSGVQDGRVWTYSGVGQTALVWNDRRPITDYYPYNQASHQRNPASGQPVFGPFSRPEDMGSTGSPPYPVSDLALTVAVEPGESPVSVTPTVTARGFVFQGVIDGVTGRAAVRMRPEDGPDDAWTELDSAPFNALRAGVVTEIEFWHVDQALWLFADGDLVCGGPERGAYTLTPAQRAAGAMGSTWADLVEFDRADANDVHQPGVNSPGVFAHPNRYRKPGVRWDFAGGPLTVHRAKVDRDIHYQAVPVVHGSPTRSAHYNNFPTLADDQFFMFGDNSPNSEDSRLWRADRIDPWVRARVDATAGVVNRDLIVGKAFIVYFPAPLDGGPLLAPDFGRVRWVW